MHTKRIIPCLDVKDGKVVKGINFKGLINVGDPVELGKYYYEAGADELVFLDVTATNEGRGIMEKVVERVSEKIFIPFTLATIDVFPSPTAWTTPVFVTVAIF